LGDVVTFGMTGPSAREPYVLPLPAGAKWMAVHGSTASPVNLNSVVEISLMMHSDGRECEEGPEKKTKKKKKKKRRS
jgi:hypothetical protein